MVKQEKGSTDIDEKVSHGGMLKMGMSSLVHKHTIVVATVRRLPEEIKCEDLESFLSSLVVDIGMKALFPPIAIQGKYGYTGMVGIVTSHIAFHFFEHDQSLHLDVYSCKDYGLETLMRFVDLYWKIDRADIVLVERDQGPRVERYSYVENALVKEVCV